MKRRRDSFKALLKKNSRKCLSLLRKPGRKKWIVVAAVASFSVVVVSTAVIIDAQSKRLSEEYVLEIDIPDSVVAENDPDSEDLNSLDREPKLELEIASEDTKVESTEDSTVLPLKEDAGRGYLNRCVFLGDSRTVAMVNYGLINDDAALAQIGISHPSFKKNNFVNNEGKQYTLKSYLQAHQSPVIYIALGVNGINDPSEEHYKSTFIDLIDTVMEQAPNSNIVIMSIGPVNDNGTYKKSVQNAWIVKYNEFLRDLAKEKNIFYLDISEILTGSDGQVKHEYDGGDGLHYTSGACEAILNYIVSHPVPGISDDGEYVVHYIKPDPNRMKITMDEGSGIDEEKLEELMNMMMEEAMPVVEDPSSVAETAEIYEDFEQMPDSEFVEEGSSESVQEYISEPANESEPQSASEPAQDSTTESEPQFEPEFQTDSEPQSESESEPESEPEAQTDPEAQYVPETESTDISSDA